VQERIRPITPQLAWRVAVLGGIAFVLFGIVFFRLWYLQVLTGQDSRAIATQNRLRKVPIEAPRGDIVDRNGNKLVTTRQAAVVQLIPSTLPQSVRDEAEQYRKQVAAAETDRLKAQAQADAFARQLRDDGKKNTKAERHELRRLRKAGRTARKVAVPPPPANETALLTLYRRISEVIGVSQKTIHERVIRGIADAPYSNITIRTDVPPEQFNYMRERPEYFKGIVVAFRYLREYPHHDLAAQLFGTVSEIHDDQIGTKHFKGADAGTRVGQSGLEYTYDKYLRGEDGYSKLVVNAFGSRDEERKVSVTEPTQGSRLKLTLDMDLQKAGDAALKQAIASSHYPARAGAYVAMDPTDGSILAMGSQPSFDANVFAKPISQSTYKVLTSNATDAPLLNRATESGYPTGSTFKPVTALAALESHLISPDRTIVDTGHWEYGGRSYQNAKGASLGPLQMAGALKVSSDIFFFQLGAWANDKGNVIQRMARQLGFGRKTGIDLPGETAGLVPDAAWRERGYVAYKACVEKNHLTPVTTPALLACGGIERPWVGGDNVNLAVGQGDLQATPLQLAVAYAALENNGTIVTPHLGMAIEDGQGVTLQEIHKKAKRHVKLDARDRDVVLAGLHAAASESGGTSADVFKDWDQKDYPVYGKTGTAERFPNPDQAWYACFVKDKGRPIVVVVTIEKGGFGAETAAPAARLILSQWFDTGDRKFHTGSSATL
jgi:penicillin-binding protein 2